MEGEQANELQNDIGYVSMSTVDNPPEAISEPAEESQGAKAVRPSDMYVGERLFNIDFSVTLSPAGGKAIKIPLLVDSDIRGTLIQQAMELAMLDRRNIQIMEAVLDNPKDRIRSGEAHPDAADKQSKLF